MSTKKVLPIKNEPKLKVDFQRKDVVTTYIIQDCTPIIEHLKSLIETHVEDNYDKRFILSEYPIQIGNDVVFGYFDFVLNIDAKIMHGRKGLYRALKYSITVTEIECQFGDENGEDVEVVEDASLLTPFEFLVSDIIIEMEVEVRK
jgi:hypothetical protein